MAVAGNGKALVVVDGCRTPFLKSGTGFRDQTAYDLARIAIAALVARTGIEPHLVGRVALGTVIANLQTSNVAREAMLGAGLPPTIPATTLTQACISANAAIADGAQWILAGKAKAVIAGGTESMSDIPIRYRKRFRHKLIEAQKYRGPGDWLKFFRGLRWSDFLPEIPTISEFSTGRTMGQDCDRLAARMGVSRAAQDQYALDSHHRAARAASDGILAQEIEPVRLPPKFTQIDGDNGIRGDSSPEKLARLKPAFVKPYGTVTAGNASFLTDGAAAVLLMDEETALKEGYPRKARWLCDLFTGQDPGEELLLGPAYAIGKILTQTGLTLEQMDVIELHEAFAGQVLANLACLASTTWCRTHLGLESAVGEIPGEKLNAHGGSLSLGHPIGATGARLLTTAANRLAREKGRYALIAACAAGAMGHAIILENPDY